MTRGKKRKRKKCKFMDSMVVNIDDNREEEE